MEKKLILIVLTVFISILSSNTAWCQKSGAGLGIILGEPTGIDGKFWLSGRTAFDAAAAWSTTNHNRNDTRFQIQGDFVFHNFSVLKRTFEVRRGDLPLYYGVGARLRLDHSDDFGIRFVGGMAYIFPRAPFDIFLEIAPI